jgi:prolyl 4-hydroxylase
MPDDNINKAILIDNFISDEDCDYLINTFDDKVFPSKVVGTEEKHASRNSSSFYMPRTDEIVKKLLLKSSTYLNVPVENFETPQFLRYMKGERYLYHHDFFKGEDVKNQRVHTILVYLNSLNEDEGGATSFYHYKQKVQPKKGLGVWFRNMNEDGTLNYNSLHAGEEILKDDSVKYAINIWSRQHKWA